MHCRFRGLIALPALLLLASPPLLHPVAGQKISPPSTRPKITLSSTTKLEVLTLGSPGKDFEEWGSSHTISSPGNLWFRWSTQDQGAGAARWEVTDKPIVPLATLAQQPKLLASGPLAQVPAAGKVSLFQIDFSKFAPATPPQGSQSHVYYVRVVPLDAQNKPVGMPSVSRKITYVAPAPGVKFLPGMGVELNGFADLHAHFMAHEAFGGSLMWGKPEGAHKDALGWCTENHGPAGISISPELGHLVGGYPEFNGWPRFTTIVHQQAHIDWIKRAHEAGLRLVSMLAVNNQLIPKRYGDVPGFKNKYPLDDKSAIDRQINAMKAMAARNSSWMEIALSSSDARRIIGQNKMAIVLGIEVDALGNWQLPKDLPAAPDAARQTIRAELQRLYNMGVRQITPIHLADNALGGCAVYHRLFDANNKYLTGQHYETEEGWSSGVRYNLAKDQGQTGFIGAIARFVAYGGVFDGLFQESEQWKGKQSHVNKKGLTANGRILLDEMTRLGMIIDVDHMSQKSTDETLGLMEAKDYPVISSHTWFRELAFTGSNETSNPHKLANESLKRADQVEKIRKLGGIVAPILNQGEIKSWGNGKVANDCAGSSKTWAQAYLYAVDKMGGRGVALGSDVNGLAGQPGPRFGTYAAFTALEDEVRKGSRRAQANAQTNGVAYKDTIKDYRAWRFESPGDLYNLEERLVWEAIAIYKSGTDPSKAEAPEIAPPQLPRLPWDNAKVVNFAKGFRAKQDSDLEGRINGVVPPLMHTYYQQRAAFLVKQGTGVSDNAHEETRRLHPIIKRIWARWEAMKGTQPKLMRSAAGRRDFDINIDGLAHYGLLADFIEDLKNVGLTQADLKPLFRSAEHYVQMWEKCESKK